MPDLLPDYLLLLVATLVLELPVVFWLGGKRALPEGVLANLLTHPFAVALYAIGAPFSFELWYGLHERVGAGLAQACEFVFVELLVIIAEILIFRFVARTSWGRAAAIALLANRLSMLASPDALRWLVQALRL